MLSGVGQILPYIHITGFHPGSDVCEALYDGFCIRSTAKAFHPVLTFIKCAEDCGCAVKAELCQFQKELNICFGQFWHEPFIQDEYLESCILVQYLIPSTGKQRLLSVFFEEIREPDISGLVLSASGFFCHCTAKEGLSGAGIPLEHDAAAVINEPATGQVSNNASVKRAHVDVYNAMDACLREPEPRAFN